MRIKFYATILACFLVFLYNKSSAQTMPGDSACVATPITPGSTCSYGPTIWTNVGSTPSGVSQGPCSGVNNGDVWFTFQVPAGVTTLICQVNGITMIAPIAYFYRATGCGAITGVYPNLVCNTGFPVASAYYAGFIPLEWIWIRVKPLGGWPDGTFQICVFNPCPSGAPANDDPCGAIPITLSTFPCASCPTTAANFCASASAGVPAPGCANYQGGDVWYSAVVPASGYLEINFCQQSLTDPGCAVYSGSGATPCSNLTLVACDDDNGPGLMPYIFLSGRTAGETLWIRVWDYGGNNLGTTGICITNPCPSGPPVNDEPCSATVVAMQTSPCSAYTTVSNYCATNSVGPPAPGCANYQTSDIWIQTTVGANGHLEINFQQQTLTDPGCAVYTGSGGTPCSNLTLVACDDNSGPGLQPYIFLNTLPASATVWIRIWDYAGNNFGTMGICLTDPCPSGNVPPPAYDDPPCPATVFIPFTSGPCTTPTVVSSICSNSTPSTLPVGLSPPPYTNCGYAGYPSAAFQGWDIWAAFIVPAGTNRLDINTGTITGSSYTSADIDFALYRLNHTGNPCTNPGAYDYVMCDDLWSNMPGFFMAGTSGGGPFVNGIPVGTNAVAPYDTLVPGDTMYIRMWDYFGGATRGAFNICINNPCPTNSVALPFHDSATCSTADTIAVTLGPCTSTSWTTGSLSCATNTPLATPGNPGCAFWNNGADVWFRVRVPAGVCQLDFNFQPCGLTDPGAAVYSGDPCGTMTLLACDDDAGVGLMPYISLSCPAISSGQYLWVRVWDYGGTDRGDFCVCVNTPCPPSSIPSNDDQCGAINLAVTGTCTFNSYDIICASPSSGAGTPSCGNFGSGRDVWFSFTAPTPSGAVIIDTRDGSLTNVDIAVYTSSGVNNCVGSYTQVANSCNDNSGPGEMPYVSLTGLTAGRTYWIRAWENGSNQDGDFQMCIYDPCPGGSPANDAPCNAQLLTVNTLTPGFNNCASWEGNAALLPACWINPGAGPDPGNVAKNTVWYKVTGDTTYTVMLNPGTLTDVQFSMYKANTNCANLVKLATNTSGSLCNAGVGEICDFGNYAGCKPTAKTASQSIDGGVTSNVYPCFVATDTIYIAVDGQNYLMGSFELGVYNRVYGNLPPLPLQDCRRAVPICGVTTNVGNPGSVGKGNFCDLSSNTSYGCLANRPVNQVEDNSAWYFFSTTGGGGLLNFDITPNATSNYDFVLWNITAGPVFSGQNTANDQNACNQITAGTSYGAPVRCDSSTQTVSTGLSLTGLGGSTGINNEPYDTSITLAATPQTFMLCIINRSGNGSGFTLDFGTSPINYAATSLVWNGASSTSDWFDPGNWGSCATPVCGIHATVNTSPDQPTITSNAAVRNLTITAGSTLTLGPGVTLSICGNFTNLGALVCDPTSTIAMIDTLEQSISGNFTGANAISNLTINKTGVLLHRDSLLSNVDITGNLTISNVRSMLWANNRYIKIAGNFANANGNITFSNTGGTVEFNGTGVQYVSNNGTASNFFQHVRINQLSPFDYVILHPSSGLSNSMWIAGNLTLTMGVVMTNQWRVIQRFGTTGVLIGGSDNSYVEGFYKKNARNLTNPATGPHRFPVGNGGYFEEARIAKGGTTGAGDTLYLEASFYNWGGLPPNGPATNECIAADWSAFPAYDNGYWRIDSVQRSGSAILGPDTLNLRPNPLISSNIDPSAQAWSIMKRTPNGSGTWGMNGNCRMSALPASATMNAASSMYDVYRDNMRGFSDFAVVQFNSPLPIELLSFEADLKDNGVLCTWTTASEVNNEYFEVERRHEGESEFRAISGHIRGAGTSSVINNYEFLDTDPCEGITYYRLRQTDFDKHTTTSYVVAVHCTRILPSIKLYPNPAKEEIKFDFYMSASGKVHVQVLDMMGKPVKEESFDARRGYDNSQKTSINELTEGMYYLRITKHGTEEVLYIERFIKIDY